MQQHQPGAHAQGSDEAERSFEAKTPPGALHAQALAMYSCTPLSAYANELRQHGA